MGLASFSFPYPNEADPQIENEIPIDLEVMPSEWPLNGGRRHSSGVAPHSAGATNPHLPKRVAGDVRLDGEASGEDEFEGIVGQSAALRDVLRLVDTVAPGDSTVLLLGETGTGKELIARAIHNRSRRRGRNLVKLNCAAIPTGLLESELFGHERGAFTGAIARKIGRLEMADGGSLFLDEIGDIPLQLQPKLLRALQEREFERLGSTRTQGVDVRIIAATHRDLEGMIFEKQFRSDLYYRLNVFPIRIPPLRERSQDIPKLVRHFVLRAASKMNKLIDAVPREIMDALAEYPWPGNIRELENIIERSVILSPGSTLRVPIQDLRVELPPLRSCERGQTLVEVEREHILATLRETRWILSGPRGAANLLGLNRATLYFRMKKLGIVRPGPESHVCAAKSGGERFSHSEFFGGELT